MTDRGGKPFEDLPELETGRLLLRKMRLDDAPAMFAYASDPEVTRYVLFETHRSVEDSEAFLRLAVEGYERGDFGGWGVVLKDSGSFVGTCGVDMGYVPEHARAELGYVLSREHWGKGLMPEAVRAVIRFGFGRMELNRIQARCMIENTASARVMEKAGMTYEGTLREHELIKGAYRNIKVYSILRREYRPA
ncbi:MAG TPA: GNAT family protein [Rubrobacteraceae bacterium]|nr:GNAT family protein [Rubrobacteraceae bacterium]